MAVLTTRPARWPGRRRARGYTLVELLVYFLVAAVVLGAVTKMLLGQLQYYGMLRAVIDVRETLRSASDALSWDLRHARMGRGPLIALGAQSVTLRSAQGLGVVCAKSATQPRYGLWTVAGSIQATADDSALIFHTGSQTWRVAKITAVGTPAAMGVATCAWAGHPVPPAIVVQIAVTSTSDTSDIAIGATFRSFRTVTYSELSSAGRYWLGRQVGAGTNDLLTGPLLAPGTSGGLNFVYYDTLGSVIALPASAAARAAVGAVQYTLRAQTYRKTHIQATGATDYRQDSLTVKIAVRR